jgi:tRNA (guanine37-N1)-methyltransferase
VHRNAYTHKQFQIFPLSFLFLQRKRFLLLNVFSQRNINEGQTLPERLRTTLAHIKTPNGEAGVYNAFDMIGDIAVVKLPSISKEACQALGQSILTRQKNIKTVLAQISRVSGDHRLRKLVCIAGENKTTAFYKEFGCSFSVDLETCYFSPRLKHERNRIAKLTQPYETVVNMFAGVGCFSILIASQVPSAKVYSIDINPAAVQFMTENIRINKVYGKVIPLLGDSKTIIQTQLCGIADRVLMPLPEKAIEYLPCAISALKKSGGSIHCHTFEHASKKEDPVQNAKIKIEKRITELGLDFEIPLSREVRRTGPHWHQIVTDIRIKG